jgi:hypothetical protein
MEACIISGNASGSGNGISSAGGLGGGIYNAGTLTLNHSAVRNNSAGRGGSDGEGGYGGGIYNSFTATLTVNDSTIDGNQTGNGGTGASGGSGGGLFNVGVASLVDSTISNNTTATGGYGGGISNIGSLDLTNSTLSGNVSREHGGGIDNASAGTVTLNSVTIANNTADSDNNSFGDGGGLYNEDGTINLANTILAGNFDPSGQAPDGSGTLTSLGYNLIQSTNGYTVTGSTTGNITGQNPQLAALADSSSPTQVHALQSASPAIDAGNPATPGSGGSACPAADQRGNQRSDRRCDIGAFEMQITDSATVVHNVVSTETYFFGPTNVQIAVTAQGTLTSLSVTQINNAPRDAEPGMQTGYYWRITPNSGASNFVLNLTFPLDGITSEYGSMVCRYNTTYRVWDCSTPTVDIAAGTVTLSGVRQLSDWALSEIVPTAVTVNSFTAKTTTPHTNAIWIVAMGAMSALLLTWTRRRLAPAVVSS